MINVPATVYRDGTPQELTDEQEKLKRHLFDTIAPRRRKFIERMGYEDWDPFSKPNNPMEMRLDVTKRTSQELVREFLKSRPEDLEYGNAYRQAALELALGIINRDEKFLGFFDFSMWYYDLLLKEGLAKLGEKEEKKESKEVDKKGLNYERTL